MRKFREWFVLLFALVVVPIHAHTCWLRTFSCLSRERTVHYMIVLIPTVFLPYTLVSNCYLVTFFFICIIRKKFEFTLHAHLRSFANITHTLSTWLCTCLIVILLLLSYNWAQMKKFWFVLPPTRIGANFKFLHSSSFGTVRLGITNSAERWAVGMCFGEAFSHSLIMYKVWHRHTRALWLICHHTLSGTSTNYMATETLKRLHSSWQFMDRPWLQWKC